MKRLTSILCALAVIAIALSPLTIQKAEANEHVFLSNYDDFTANFYFVTGSTGSYWEGDNQSLVISAGNSGSSTMHREELIIHDGKYLNISYKPVTNGTYSTGAILRINEITNRFFINSTGEVGYYYPGAIALDTVEFDQWHTLSLYFNASTDVVGVNFDTDNISKEYHWFVSNTAFDDGDKFDDCVIGGAYGALMKYFLIEYKNFTYGDSNYEDYYFDLPTPTDDASYEYTRVWDLEDSLQTREANPHSEHTYWYITVGQNTWYNNDSGYENGRIMHSRTLEDIVPGAQYFQKYYINMTPATAWNLCNQSDDDAVHFSARIDGYDGTAPKLYNTSVWVRWLEQNNTDTSIHCDYNLLQQNYTLQSTLEVDFSITSDIAEEFFNSANKTADQDHFIYIWIGNNRTALPSAWYAANPLRTNYDGGHWAVFDSFGGPRPGETMVLDMFGYVKTDTPTVTATLIIFDELLEMLIGFLPLLVVIGALMVLFRLFVERDKY